MATKTLEELLATDDPAWPQLQKLLAAAHNPCEVLPPDRARSEQLLVSLQVTPQSTLGALALETGGVLVKGGLVRILGGGHERLQRDLGSWNLPPDAGGKARIPGAMLVADDAFGGFFAVNGGRFHGEPGRVHYLSPRSLSWEDLEVGHTQLVHFLANGDLDSFYEDMLFEGLEEELGKLAGHEALFSYPPLFADAAERQWKAVPVEELWGLHAVELPARLAAARGGTPSA